jgi:hypothetical protein
MDSFGVKPRNDPVEDEIEVFRRQPHRERPNGRE